MHSLIDDNHPIATTRYVVQTVAIEKLYDNVHEWIELIRPGAIVYGVPRLGKSTALHMLKQALLTNWPSWCFLITNVPLERRHENSFYKDLLKAVGHTLCREGDATDKRHRFIEFLVERAQEVGEGRIVLFADEAQKLDKFQYNWLMDIHNHLGARGINLSVEEWATRTLGLINLFQAGAPHKSWVALWTRISRIPRSALCRGNRSLFGI